MALSVRVRNFDDPTGTDMYILRLLITELKTVYYVARNAADDVACPGTDNACRQPHHNNRALGLVMQLALTDAYFGPCFYPSIFNVQEQL